MTNLEVTKRAITLGTRNTTTGWRAITYTTSTKKTVIQPSNQARANLPPGYHASYAYVGITQDAFIVGDQILDTSNQYYLVEKAAPCNVGDNFDHYILELSLLTEWQAVTGSTTWSLTRLKDPRDRVKTYIDLRCRVAQITKDNDSTQASWAAIFDNPPYPMHLEFRHLIAPVQGLYVCGRAQSKALKDNNLSAYGYIDDCLVDICTVDSTACSGWALAWKMEHELRYAFETYPSGSLWEFDTSELKHVPLGSMWMYDLPVHITYERTKT